MIDEHQINQLMILEAIGNISPEDSAELLKVMNYRKDFPLNELGELQNLAALLALTAEEVIPSIKVKQKLLQQLKNKTGAELVIDEEPENLEVMEDLAELERVAALKVRKSQSEAISFKEPDLNELKIFNHPEDFEEVKSRASLIKEKQHESSASEKPSKIKEFRAADFLKESSKKERKPLNRTTLLVISVFLIAIIGIGFVYLVSSGGDNDVQDQKVEEHNKQLISKGEKEFEKLEEFKSAESVKLSEEETSSHNEVNSGEQEISLLSMDNQSEEVIKLDQAQIENLPEIEPPLMIEAPLIDPENTETNNTGSDDKLASMDAIPPPPKEDIKIDNETVYFVAVEEMPEPIGGLASIQAKIIYPEIARRAGVEGKVFVRAFVDESGTVIKAEVTKGIGLGCDEAAVDAILKTKFKPGTQRGKPIKVQVTIPITFKHK